MATEIEEELSSLEEHPKLTMTFTPDGVEVELFQWEKINARLFQKGIRAYTRERNRRRQQALRKLRGVKEDG